MGSKSTDVDVKLTKAQLSTMKQVSGLKGTVSDKAILKAFITYSLNNLRWKKKKNLDIEGEHIAPFPKQIITLPILQTSEIGDLVLDPFCGSGNVGKVFDVLERNFVGYDLNNYLSWNI